MASLLIRQFDVFANPTRRTAQAFPFLVVLQSDWVSDTSSVIVAPFLRHLRAEPSRLHPEFTISGRRFALAVTDRAALPRSVLNEPVANLGPERDRIVAALDLRFTGA